MMNAIVPSFTFISFDPDAALRTDKSSLGEAAARCDLKKVEELLDQGHQPTPELLFSIAGNGASDIMQVLAWLVSDIDQGVGWVGNTLCAAAASQSGCATVKVLLDCGADINWQGGAYGTPLQGATANYRLDSVKLLVERGAEVGAQCGHYGNALTAAARHFTHFEEMATLLLANGADIDAQGPGVYGNPLQTAVYVGHTSSVRFLMDCGANPYLSGRFGSAIEIAEKGMRRYSTEQEEILRILHGQGGFITDGLPSSDSRTEGSDPVRGSYWPRRQ